MFISFVHSYRYITYNNNIYIPVVQCILIVNAITIYMLLLLCCEAFRSGNFQLKHLILLAFVSPRTRSNHEIFQPSTKESSCHIVFQ